MTVPVRVPEMASIFNTVVLLLLNLAVGVSPVSPLTVEESRKETGPRLITVSCLSQSRGSINKPVNGGDTFYRLIYILSCLL